MCNKTIELNAANQKLTELINKLQDLKSEYRKDVEHSANYYGNDDRIDEFRDNIAMETLARIEIVKEQITSQIKLLRELADNY
ncbi:MULTISPECIES: hypothetical protein [Vibrio]|uniref:Uncharacterized protein n=1 Tax=Vibrio splendidus TaxID=29497 RepID=A0A2T5EJQ7_VIBSP|nr:MULTISPECIES: hypothetical protein [Vibrio]EHY9845535.1 hypothetical protein [Vibrio cholerae]MCS0096609.1 hypothetical protein [Vibrio cholerae]NOI05838.1 hypothetical protein [Vibrio anguillarum]OCQ08673.1 hypothetical protein AKH09_10900 [Vibrio parahaemolyticus]OEE57299.1 hypothetical protein A147_05180 [Vibrio splendidus FF-6]